MTRVLVTGANGFIGRHVVEALEARGAEIIAVSRRAGAQTPGRRWIEADLLTLEGRAGIAKVEADILVHTAWETTHGHFWTAPENTTWQEASIALAGEFLARGGRRIVALGTCVEYDLTGEAPLDEASTPLRPVFPYAIAKHATREALSSLCAKAGASFVWARIFHLFGPFEHPNRLVPAVARALLRGEEARTTSGEQMRDFLSSVDCGQAIAHLALADIAGPINVGSGEALSIAALVNEIGHMLNAEHLVRLGALPARPDEPRFVVPTIDRLLATGFCPARNRHDRLLDVLEFWKAELRL